MLRDPRFLLAIDLPFNFELQVEVYMAPSALKLKIEIDSDEKLETRFQIYTKQG
jgi:hypothetical protein